MDRREQRQRTPRHVSTWLSGVLLLAAVTVMMLLASSGAANAAPVPAPSPSSPAASTGCATKAPGQVAWCMPWAVHVATPPAGARSHWVTQCSKATTAADKRSCSAASLTLDDPPRDSTASVLMDGPTDGGGLAAQIDCRLLGIRAPGDPTIPSQWRSKQNQCVAAAGDWAKAAFDPNPKAPDCSVADVSCKVQRGAQDALSAGLRSGVQGLVDMAVGGMVFLLSKLAELVFKVTSISSADDAFYSTYNSIAGVLVLLIFVFFIVSTIINGLRTGGGPSPLSSLGGLVRAVFGITFAGGIAYTIVAAWDQATNALIEHNARTPWDPSVWVKAFTGLTGGVGTMFIAFVLSLLAMFGLVMLFIVMLFRGVLATGAALFGAMAMTGQVMPETRHWGRRWFWTINALASSKFFIAGLWIYGSRSAYGSDNLLTALKAVLIIWLMVIAPFILLRLTAMWDGYLSDVNAHAVIATAGNPVDLGEAFLDGVRGGSGSGGGGGTSGGGAATGGDPGVNAVGMMNATSADVATTPSAALGEATGTQDGPGREAADAAATGQDGGAVGDPSAAATAAGGEPGQDASVGSPNADEASGIEADTGSARHDAAAGELTAPGDSTGADGALPVTPSAAAHGGDPAGVNPAAGDAGGPDANGAAGAEALPSTAEAPGGLGGPTGTDAPGGHGTGAASPDAATPVSGEGHEQAPNGGEQQPAGGSDPAAGAGPASSGGAGGAAAAAADVPIVPL